MTSPNPQEGGKRTPGELRAEREVDLNGIETGKLWIVMRGAPCAYDFDRYEDAVLAAAAPALLEALKGARAIVAEELDCLIRSCSLDGTAATLDADARDEVARVQASLDKIDAALTLTGART